MASVVPSSLRDIVLTLEYVSAPVLGYLKSLSRAQKAFALSTICGIGVIMAVGRLMRRSKRPRNGVTPNHASGGISRTRAQYRRLVAHDDFAFRGGGSVDGYKFRNNSSSVCSDHQSTSTLITMLAGDASVAGAAGVAAPCTAQQLGLMGLEALETAIGYWEDAELSFSREAMTGSAPLALTSASEDELLKKLQVLLEKAYRLQDEGEAMFLHQGSLLFSREESLATPRQEGTLTRTMSQSSEGGDSFHSAMSEMSDELMHSIVSDGAAPDLNQLPLYKMALNHYQEHGIPTRGLHTELVGLTSDDDYRIKVHCLRLGFQYVFEQDGPRRWFADAGSQILSDLFVRAQKDPREVLMCFEEMVNFLLSPNGRRTMMFELKSKGYPATTFFDVVVENLLEAFGHLDDPPAFVLAVTSNRWLSSRFKESALAASLWSLIKAKKSSLENPEGYLSRYYDLMAHAAPVVIWGFLGTEPQLNQICYAIKDEFTGYIQDIFSFRKVQYTNMEDLSQDLWRLAKQRHDLLAQRLAL